MKDIYSVFCKEFNDACQEKYGIHGMILYRLPENFSKWKTYTYSDFCEYIIIRDWGISEYSNIVEIFNELDYMDDIIKIVYSRNGYYPGNYYDKL